MNLRKSFLKYCEDKELEINQSQFDIVDNLENYHLQNFKQPFFNKIFKKKNKPSFYLVGDVGVGKTMILNFFF